MGALQVARPPFSSGLLPLTIDRTFAPSLEEGGKRIDTLTQRPKVGEVFNSILRVDFGALTHPRRITIAMLDSPTGVLAGRMTRSRGVASIFHAIRLGCG